ncbi:DNA-binding response regulator, NarL/FixJ family, contains REC and HTH domains [Salipiger marinus]|jgi:DNA-binding CsgD family transcriptional regulator|uniref:DNA-binding response regulator, NarL/FixJ family, contains REC and HTH domains n=2 Tax=Salipiger marinus TaxID=555512 RepID=A0A1G8HZN3_9RHOB|nr:DNA-binding response regulator, NarL/FixJ family, contains REC and HTH domains [Salipiger marinus]
MMAAEQHVPELLQRFLIDLETTQGSEEVWRLIVCLGRELKLPCVDFIGASAYRNWKKTLFLRTSYDSAWLSAYNADPDLARWSYFRSHAMDRLTPIAVGLEFLDDYHPLPEARVAVLREAARRGMRAGFSIPLRQNAPSQVGLLTFTGNHSRRDMQRIIQAHGWTLSMAALTAHQRYMYHFTREFPERNQITGKQLELLEMIGAGHQDKQIAAQLEISVSAVRQRLNALIQNTGLSSRTELAALAMSLGVLPDPLHKACQAQVDTQGALEDEALDLLILSGT